MWSVSNDVMDLKKCIFCIYCTKSTCMYKNRQSLPSHKLHLIFLRQQAITKFSIKHVNVYNMDSPWFVQKISKIYFVIVFMFFLYQINTQPIFSFPSPLFLHPLPSFSSTPFLHFPPPPFCYQNTSPQKLLFLHNFFCFYLFIRFEVLKNIPSLWI